MANRFTARAPFASNMDTLAFFNSRTNQRDKIGTTAVAARTTNILALTSAGRTTLPGTAIFEFWLKPVDAQRRGKSMAANGWSRRFDEPIPLPGGAKLVTLQHAIAWLAKEVPKSEHGMKQVQAAAHCVTEVAENGGPMMIARIGVMQAINRRKPEEFDPKRKGPHWGKRKLKRDQ
jgi:hypothetical protein